MAGKFCKKVSVLAILLIITLALTCIFTLYQSSVNSAVRNVLDNADDSLLNAGQSDVNVAYASGSRPAKLQTRAVSFKNGTYSYSISLAASTSYLGGKWDTDTDHTSANATYTTTTWQFGNGDRHQYGDVSSAWLDIDLGEQAGLLASTGSVKLVFSGYFSKSGDIDNGTFNIFSSSSYFGTGIPNIHEQSRDGTGPNAMFSGENTGSRTYSGEKALGGRYIRVILSAWDDDGFFGGPYGWVKMDQMSLQLVITEKTAPTITPTSNTASNAVTINDSSGIRSYAITYLRPGESTPVTAGSGGSTSSVVTNYNISLPEYGYYTITATDQAGNTKTVNFYYYSGSVSIAAGNNGTVSGPSSFPNLYNASYTIKAKTTSSGYYFIGWEGSEGLAGQYLGVGSYNSGDSYWSVSTNVQFTKNTVQKWTAKFQPILDIISIPQGMVYDGSPQTAVTVNPRKDLGNNNLSYSVSYSGTTFGGTAYPASDTPPTYAGNYKVTVSILYNNQVLGSGEYEYTVQRATLQMTPSFSKTDKPYDGTTSFNYFQSWSYSPANSLAQNTDKLVFTNNSEVVFYFDNANVGTGKTINTNASSANVSISSTADSYADDRAASYVFGLSSTKATAAVTAKSVTVSIAYNGTADGKPGKIYDATTSADVNITITGLVKGETCAIGSKTSTDHLWLSIGEASFDSDAPGSRTVTLTGIRLNDGTGGKATNYTLTNAIDTTGDYYATCTATIAKRPVRIIITEVSEKTYDGTVAASVKVAFDPDEGLCAGDESMVTIVNGTASFDSAEAGARKVSLSGYSLGGAKSVCYELIGLDDVSADGTVKQRELTVTFTYGGKIYDGTADVVGDLAFDYVNIVEGDKGSVTASCTAVFNNPNAGSRTVNATGLTISGSKSGNYVLTSTTYTLGNVTILPKSVEGSISSADIAAHPYDGYSYKPAPEITDTVIGAILVAGSDYTLEYSSDTINAGTCTLTVRGSGNYTGSTSFNYNIEQASLKLGASDISITYGETLTASNITGTSAYNANRADNDPLAVNGTWSIVTAYAYNTSLAEQGYSNIPLVSASGDLTLRFVPSDSQNYITDDTSVTDITVTLTVTKRNLTVTAAAQKTTYGALPAFNASQYTTSVEGTLHFLLAQDTTFNGSLECEVAYLSPVGKYPITSTFASPNYEITYVGADFTVEKRAVTVIPDKNQSKYYGDDDPEEFTYTLQISGTAAEGFVPNVNGTLERTAGETADMLYPYRLGTVTADANPNYSITLQSETFSIVRRPVTVTASSHTVYFGEDIGSIILTYTVTDMDGKTVINQGSSVTVGDLTDTFNVSVIRTAQGNTAETSAITAGIYDTYIPTKPSDASGNYTITAVRGSFEIAPRPVTITPRTGLYKTYGATDSAISYDLTFSAGVEGLTGTPQVSGYPLNGSLTREEGESAGEYLILQGGLTDENNPNYSITFVENVIFTINRKSVTVNPDYVVIDFGDPLPEISSLTYTVTGLVGDDKLIGGLVFADNVYDTSPVSVGKYDILPDETLSDPDENSNYNITVIGTERFEVCALTAYVDATGNRIVFGDASFTLSYTAKDRKGNVIDPSVFTGKLDLLYTMPVDDILPAGRYAITRGSLSSENYIVVLNTDAEGNPPYLEVLPKLVTVTSADVSQVYGEEPTAIEIVSVDGLVEPYRLVASGKLDAEYPAREAVGQYRITLGNLEDVNPNYDFVFDRDYYYTITPRPIVIVPSQNATSVYGNADANITYTTHYKGDPDKAGLIGTDTLGGKLSREQSTVSDAGSYRVILGTVNNPSVAGYNANYTVELDTALAYYTITRRPVTVTAVAQSKIFGEAERVLTVTYSLGGLAGGDTALKGTVSRAEGITPGTYAITQGTITNDENPNYDITFVGANYVIAARPVVYYALNASKGYGEADPDSYEYYAYGGTGTDGKAFVTDYEPDVIVTRAAGREPDQYAYSYSVAGKFAEYYVFTFKYDTYFTIERGQAVVSVKEAVDSDGDGILEIYRTYSGESYKLETELLKGEDEDLVTAIRINNVVTDTYTSAGEYTAVVSVAGNSCYAGTSVTVRITVKPYNLGKLSPSRALDSTSVMKTYRDADPAFTAYVNGLNGAKVSVTFTRVAGENAGVYLFDSVTVNDKNYTASIAANEYFTVNAREIAIVPETFQKIYGALDPELTQTVTSDVGESFEVTFSREDGYNVGSYDITDVTLEEGFADNYIAALREAEDKFVIVPKAATVTANALSRVFDATDGGVTLTYTASGFLYDDAKALEGALGIAERDTLPVEAGTYAIVAATAFTHANYTVTYVGAEYVIQRAPVTVIADNVTYEYGETIAPFTYYVEGTVYDEYPLEGALGTLASVNVGSHEIPQGTLDNEHNPNYDITYKAGICTVTVIRVTVTPVPLTEQVYGDAPVRIVYTIKGNVVPEDVDENGMFLRGALASESYNAGEHAVTAGTVITENPDYDITFNGEGAVYRVLRRSVIVTADEVSVYYGDDEAALTFTVSGVVEGETLKGALTRTIGKYSGSYLISAGTLANHNNPNYDITFVAANYVILPRPVTVLILDQSVEFSATGDTAFDASAYSVVDGNVIEGDDLGIVLTRETGSAMGFYEISGSYTDKNYDVTFVNGVYEIRKYSSVIEYTANVSFIYNGTAYAIDAICSSGAEIVVSYEVDGVTSNVNSFVNAGKYTVTVSAPETAHYYAPESVIVSITILQDALYAEEGGIDIRIDNEEGFDPDLSVQMDTLPKDDQGINSVISSSESIVRAYNVQVVDGNGDTVTSTDKHKISVKVPSALKDNDSVKVIVKEADSYSVRILEVKEGYVTIDNAAEVTTIAFISEAESDYLIYILIGCAALIIIVSTIVFMFRKRA